MPNDPLVISIVGPSGAGKTTVIERLIPLLHDVGLRVGTSKHASHGYTADRPGSDSWRHNHAGADTVLLVGPEGAAVFLARHVAHPNPDRDPHDDIARLITDLMRDVDIVLAEGYAPIHDLLIEVRRHDVPPKQPAEPSDVWITITDRPREPHHLSFDQLDHVAAKIIERHAAPSGSATAPPA